MGPLPFERVLPLLDQAAWALAYLHDHGFCHRDVKSSNRRVDARDPLTLIDSGLLRIPGGRNLTEPGTLLGTPACRPPVQRRCVNGEIAARPTADQVAGILRGARAHLLDTCVAARHPRSDGLLEAAPARPDGNAIPLFAPLIARRGGRGARDPLAEPLEDQGCLIADRPGEQLLGVW